RVDGGRRRAGGLAGRFPAGQAGAARLAGDLGLAGGLRFAGAFFAGAALAAGLRARGLPAAALPPDFLRDSPAFAMDSS
ncbi:MAG: hypothetical protein ACFCVH_15130, partial [Alphaproteobacteria bacterium]